MAEVLRPFLPSTSPISAVDQGPPSTSDNFARGSAPQQSPSPSRIVQMPRNNHSHPHNGGVAGYRGTSAAPTYAFKATPNLKTESRAPAPSSNPSTTPQPPPLSNDSGSAGNRQRYPGPPSVSTTSSSTTSSNPSSAPSAHAPVTTWSQLFTKNDSSLTSNFEIAPFTTEKAMKTETKPPALPEPDATAFPPLVQASSIPDNNSKQAPGRYRRNNKKPDTSQPASENQTPESQPPMGQFAHSSSPATSLPKLTTEIPSFDFSANELEKSAPVESDVVSEPQASSGAEQNGSASGLSSFKRYRRRSSVNTLDSASKTQPVDPSKVAPSSPAGERPSSPLRPSSVSYSPMRISFPSNSMLIFYLIIQAKQNQRPSSPSRSGGPTGRSDGSSGPARTFAEVARRTNAPSPLSRPMTPDQKPKNIDPSSPPAGPPSAQNTAFQNSPAVAAMAALSDKDPQKGVKSKLRRAFSFGSSAELRKAGAEVDAKDRAQARREQFSSELDEEQANIARQQEAAGLGESIYSGQAGFVGSTDNLSISSTASSASMMLRKMGKGMKKGGRSIKGIFRPKSAIGVPPPDGPLGAGVSDVSRVTVEAEREKVNVNVDPKDQSGGGTGFPKLERNSMETSRVTASDVPVNGQVDGLHDTRRSIVGSELERQEVLASVKRSILKRSSTANTLSPITTGSTNSPFMKHDNTSAERQPSPAPSNTSSEPKKNGQMHSESATVGADYFGKFPKVSNQSFRSLPGTPRSIVRNISFSPRIQFYDVWSSTEYDRRGDIATCNRLTPMLAQQIKEELNTFKMVSFSSNATWLLCD